MANKKLYRSRNADFLGVCHGIAEWRGLPVGVVQLTFVIVSIATAVLPCLAIYLVAAILIPLNPYEDGEYEEVKKDRKRNSRDESYSASSYSSSNEDLNERFERLKKKVYETEAKVEDSERQWDDKFYNSTK